MVILTPPRIAALYTIPGIVGCFRGRLPCRLGKLRGGFDDV
jgi:hypothetical protein